MGMLDYAQFTGQEPSFFSGINIDKSELPFAQQAQGMGPAGVEGPQQPPVQQTMGVGAEIGNIDPSRVGAADMQGQPGPAQDSGMGFLGWLGVANTIGKVGSGIFKMIKGNKKPPQRFQGVGSQVKF